MEQNETLPGKVKGKRQMMTVDGQHPRIPDSQIIGNVQYRTYRVPKERTRFSYIRVSLPRYSSLSLSREWTLTMDQVILGSIGILLF